MSDLADLFPGFESRVVPGDGADIFVRLGGSGPPLLVLHGYPQSGVMWHRVAPKLAEHFSLVIADLRGYGQSSVPDSDAENYAYSKRAMARDMIAVMAALGHERFSLLGHDRGARVGYRLALDAPEHLERLALLDIVPTHAMWHRLNANLALRTFHWTFLAQPYPFPEKMIGSDVDAYLDNKMTDKKAGKGLDVFAPEAFPHYRANIADPARLKATCDDYRAGATYDLKADEEDMAKGRKIACPTLVLWGAVGIPGRAGGPLDIWRDWCTDLRGAPIECGHYIPEEAPDATLAHVVPFLKGA